MRRQKYKTAFMSWAHKKPKRKEAAKKKQVSEKRQSNRLVILITVIVLIAVTSTMFFIRGDVFDRSSTPDHITVTVAWNPGSIADDMVRAMSAATDTQISLLNITGANGATGANAVFQSERDGTELLSTSLSTLVTAEATGFSEHSQKDWEAWLCAFSPAVIVIADDSPYHSMDDLITAIRQNPGRLRCADSGFGTVSFAAAELLSTRVILEIDQISFAGSSQAVRALQNSALAENEAEFAVLLSCEITEYLRTGQIRAIGVFSNEEFILHNDNAKISIPAISGIDSRLDAVLPFGEYFGLFIPADTALSGLHSLDSLINTSVDSEVFSGFTNKAGLANIKYDRHISGAAIEHFSPLINWTLYDTGFLPTNPETLGIPRP